MSIDYERATLEDGSVHVPLRHRGRPSITTTDEAIAYVREVLAEVRVYPEEADVRPRADVEGRLRLAAVSDGSSAYAVRKAAEIRGAACDRLRVLSMMTQMPDLVIVTGDMAAPLWDGKVYHLAAEGEAEKVAPVQEAILALLRKAGEEGMVAVDLWARYSDEASAEGYPYVSREAFMRHLRLVEGRGLASRSGFGRWTIAGVTTSNDSEKEQ